MKLFLQFVLLQSAYWTNYQVIKEGIYECRTKSKACKKESTSRKPREIKLHTQQRTISDYEVVTKLYLIKQQKNQLVEEEEIHLLRKEMVPRAQLVPFFDRPFFPQRSNSPLTIPREPTFGLITRKCSTSKHCSWEEEEIRLLRKEMVPRAQLMPFFDRPFFSQRSNRPLTIPREPTFGLITRTCSTSKHCSWG
ncbi:hypothetical protein UlMin_043861 [Ulmus minor]